MREMENKKREKNSHYIFNININVLYKKDIDVM